MEEIKNLKIFTINNNGKKIFIKYSVCDSMHDGKEITIITKEILR